MAERDKRIDRFQENLSTLRKVAGWSAEDLGDKLDLTRQTIMNLESKRIEMTKVQYIAFRSVFEIESLSRPNETLGKLITILVDNDDVSSEEKEDLKNAVNAAASSVGPRAGSAAASKKAIAELAAFTSIAAAAASTMLPILLPATAWLVEIVSEKKK